MSIAQRQISNVNLHYRFSFVAIKFVTANSSRSIGFDGGCC